MLKANNEIELVSSWQSNHHKVVLVTGVFDLLHIEHIRFLKKAKAVGDKLMVGIESDGRVKTVKGQERPLNSEMIRLEQLQALHSVDHAFVLPASFNSQAEWEQLMASLKPDVYAVSSHTHYLENKQRICEKFGIAFKVVHEFNPEFSSTTLIEKLISTR